MRENKNMELLQNEFNKYEIPDFNIKERNKEARNTIDFSEAKKNDKIKLENSLDSLD